MTGRRIASPSITDSSSRTAASPLPRTGWWTVVRGGSVEAARSTSSKPTTLISPGTAAPRSSDRADGADRHRVAHAQDRRRPAAGVPDSIERGAAAIDAGRPDRDRLGRQLDSGFGQGRPCSPRRRRPTTPCPPLPVERGPSMARMAMSRWPSSSTWAAARRAPPSSSTSIDATLPVVVRSRREPSASRPAGSRRSRGGRRSGRSRRRRRRSLDGSPASASHGGAR